MEWLKLVLRALSAILGWFSWKSRKARMEQEAREFEEEVQEGVSSIPKPELDESENAEDPMGTTRWNSNSDSNC